MIFEQMNRIDKLLTRLNKKKIKEWNKQNYKLEKLSKHGRKIHNNEFNNDFLHMTSKAQGTKYNIFLWWKHLTN